MTPPSANPNGLMNRDATCAVARNVCPSRRAPSVMSCCIPDSAAPIPVTCTCARYVPCIPVRDAARRCTSPRVNPSWSASCPAALLVMPMRVAVVMNAARVASTWLAAFSIDPEDRKISAAAFSPDDATASSAAWLSRPFCVWTSRDLPFFVTASVAASIALSYARTESRCPRRTFAIPVRDSMNESLAFFASCAATACALWEPASPSTSSAAFPLAAASTALLSAVSRPRAAASEPACATSRRPCFCCW